MPCEIGVQVIPHEQEIELSALGGLCDVENHFEVREAVVGPRITPARGMTSCAEQEKAYVHLACHGEPGNCSGPPLCGRCVTEQSPFWRTACCRNRNKSGWVGA